MSLRCQGITLRGTRCHLKTVTGYCHLHCKDEFRQTKPSECLICCESLINQKYALECGHWIHTNCIINSAKAECPVCRKPLNLGPRSLARLLKIAKKRKLQDIQEEEEDLRNNLQDHVATLIGPLLQERLQDAVGVLLENMEDLNDELIDEEVYQRFMDTLLNYE